MRGAFLAGALLAAACAHAPAAPAPAPDALASGFLPACRRAVLAKLDGVQPQQADAYAAAGCSCILGRLRASAFGARAKALRSAEEAERVAADFAASAEGAAALRDCRDSGAKASGLVF